MADLDELKEMAKEGAVSKKLLGDESFKEEFKKTLKEENGIELTDEQFSEVIKTFENNLKDEKLLEDIELANVSGGSSVAEKIALGVFFAAPVVGAIAGGIAGGKLAYNAIPDAGEHMSHEAQHSHIRHTYSFGSGGYRQGVSYETGPVTNAVALAATAGVVLGGAAGTGVSALIYKMFD